jgi:hypothetical protein
LAAATGASTNASVIEIKIGDLAIIELAADASLSSVKLIEKQPTHFTLSQDYQFANQHKLAKMLKASGYFDYSFTQQNEANNIFSIAYTDMERVEGKGGRKLVVNLVNYISESQEFSADKFVIPTEASFTTVGMAKPGFLLVKEYYRKKKTMTFRLEPINI